MFKIPYLWPPAINSSSSSSGS